MPSSIRVPVVCGLQGGETFYAGAISAGLLTRIAVFADPDLPPEDRAQRAVDLRHAKQIGQYILGGDYTFSSIEITILGSARFAPVGDEFGHLEFPEGTALLINDGQHRTKGFELAIAANPEIAKDEVKVAFHINADLDRSRQRFADLNGHAKVVSRALNLLYDQRDPEAGITRKVIAGVPLLKALTECEQNSLPKSSRKLFTLNGLHEATSTLLCGQEDLSLDKQVALAVQFWTAVAEHIPDWGTVYRKEALSSEVRQESLHSQAIALIALGKVGAQLLKRHPQGWQKHMVGLAQVDWSRSNPVWQGRIIFDGVIKKNRRTVDALYSILAEHLGVAHV